jgi:hypothetical protein
VLAVRAVAVLRLRDERKVVLVEHGGKFPELGIHGNVLELAVERLCDRVFRAYLLAQQE